MAFKWTEQKKMFKREYLKDLNATQAAIRANYSEKTAYSQGQRLLKSVEMQAAIQKEMDKRAKKVEISAENVLQDIMDTRKICIDNMFYIDKEENKRIDTAAINARNKTNELLGKHLKLFTDKVEHSGEINIPQIVINKSGE